MVGWSTSIMVVRVKGAIKVHSQKGNGTYASSEGKKTYKLLAEIRNDNNIS